MKEILGNNIISMGTIYRYNTIIIIGDNNKNKIT